MHNNAIGPEVCGKPDRIRLRTLSQPVRAAGHLDADAESAAVRGVRSERRGPLPAVQGVDGGAAQSRRRGCPKITLIDQPIIIDGPTFPGRRRRASSCRSRPASRRRSPATFGTRSWSRIWSWRRRTSQALREQVSRAWRRRKSIASSRRCRTILQAVDRRPGHESRLGRSHGSAAITSPFIQRMYSNSTVDVENEGHTFGSALSRRGQEGAHRLPGDAVAEAIAMKADLIALSCVDRRRRSAVALWWCDAVTPGSTCRLREPTPHGLRPARARATRCRSMSGVADAGAARRATRRNKSIRSTAGSPPGRSPTARTMATSFFPRGTDSETRLGEIIAGRLQVAPRQPRRAQDRRPRPHCSGRARCSIATSGSCATASKTWPCSRRSPAATRTASRSITVNGRDTFLLFPAKLYCGQSLLDGRRESVIIDYAFTDELPGLPRESRRAWRAQRVSHPRRDPHGAARLLSRPRVPEPHLRLELHAVQRATQRPRGARTSAPAASRRTAGPAPRSRGAERCTLRE